MSSCRKLLDLGARLNRLIGCLVCCARFGLLSPSLSLPTAHHTQSTQITYRHREYTSNTNLVNRSRRRALLVVICSVPSVARAVYAIQHDGPLYVPCVSPVYALLTTRSLLVRHFTPRLLSLQNLIHHKSPPHQAIESKPCHIPPCLLRDTAPPTASLPMSPAIPPKHRGTIPTATRLTRAARLIRPTPSMTPHTHTTMSVRRHPGRTNNTTGRLR